MKVIARHATNTYDIAIIQFETGNRDYWCVTIDKDTTYTFDRTRSLEIAQASADREWAIRMGLKPSKTKGPFTA